MIHCNKNQNSTSAPEEHLIQDGIPPDTQLNYSVSSHVKGIESIWDAIQGTVFMSSEYLGGLESAPAKGMDFKYVMVNAGVTPVARLYFQIVHFNAARSLGQQVPRGSDKCTFFTQLVQTIKKNVARNIDFHTIVCGNLLLTGENGWVFADQLSKTKREEIFEKAYSLVREMLRQTHKDEMAVSLLKEKYPDHRLSKEFIQSGKWHEFQIQPNMLLQLDPAWLSFNDYLHSMHSKYRIRARRALKKLGEIKLENLSLAAIKEHSPSLYNLYLETTGGAGFNMVHLGIDYFYETRKNMGSRFQVKVFKRESKIVGFFSYFLNNDSLVAHMVGFDDTLNKTHQIYLNMLYQLVEEGIQHRLDRINLGRTAMEIKSSVGAYPVNMYCYIRHRNKIYNKITPNLIDLLSPQDVWVQRHPFKTDENTDQ